MAAQLNVTEEENLERIRRVRDALRDSISHLINELELELKANWFKGNGKVTLWYNLLGVKFDKLEKMDEEIHFLTPSNELEDEVQSALDFTINYLNKTASLINKENTRAKVEQLYFELLYMPRNRLRLGGISKRCRKRNRSTWTRLYSHSARRNRPNRELDHRSSPRHRCVSTNSTQNQNVVV